ncbi:lantibiotic synthetase [Streptococcus pneumoniae]|uniref:class III lanthionine synthetase LanKC N-terminal domain-containing protein n=3 Tax=Streptococcus pneumoniae TaxID=1313 RepID=UPI0007655F0E|nr:ATP-binding cassette domain-containing protein [Streptococcus pneumoniae]CVO45870.1 lantibiotic synthetase [Streptococcus pneumoniae]
MDYNFNLEHPFFFTNNDYSTDTSIKYQVSLPFNWHEVMNNDEWVYQYPIGKFVERQGWKIHISSEYNSSHELLQDVAKICHEMRIPFKHLSTEDKFIMRNGKLVSRGFSGKFITCYPNQNELESVLQRLESALKQYNGPYILSDKRWDEAPIYLRYGVFRPSRDDEKKVAIDELIVGDEVVKDERLPVFKIPKGIVPPDFLNKWLDKKDKKQGDFPFIIDNAIRFSNSGGIYNARLKEDGKKIILKEARPYTGLGFDGTYSSEKLASECKALKILNEWSETPKIYWHGKIWEHTFLGIEHMKGVPLNRWVTNNFPLYEVVDKTKDYLLRVSKIVEKLIDLTNKFHSENVYHQDLHLGNILVKDEDEISIIDWEQAVFSNDEKVVHKVAAPGFRAWRETLPSEIDWYGIRQIAHYLYMPLVTTSDLTYNYVSQTRIEGKKLFESLGYTREHIDYVESLLSYLDSKCPQIENISRKKVLKPMHEIRTIESEQDIQDFIIKLLRGFTLTYGQWRKEFQSRFFPVHYYGLNFNQGIAFSDLAILWSYQQLAKKVKNFKFDDYYEIRTQVINEAVNNFKKSSLSGLFDGKIGTIWLIYEFGEIDRAVELFTTHFIEIFENSQNKNLYSGQVSIDFSFKSPFRVLLTGTSGSGKTTILNLINGSLKPQKGYVNLLSHGKKSSDSIPTVDQTPYIFDTTIRENVTLFQNEYFSDDQIIEVLKKVNLYEELEKIDILNYQYGENGSNLSGGQKQKIALARALIRNNKVYLFDEISANLDNDNSNSIHDILFNLGISFIEVSHHYDLNDKRYTDIYKLENGTLFKIK